MLKILNYNNKNSSSSLIDFLGKRKFTQRNLASTVNKIIKNVKKNGDKAVIKYEKKCSKIRVKSNKVIFSCFIIEKYHCLSKFSFNWINRINAGQPFKGFTKVFYFWI